MESKEQNKSKGKQDSDTRIKEWLPGWGGWEGAKQRKEQRYKPPVIKISKSWRGNIQQKEYGQLYYKFVSGQVISRLTMVIIS